MADGVIDSVICDPPYGVAIAGWDHGVPPAAHWAEVRRVTRPGGYLFAFGGARMWHRLACAIEDAGWQITADSMMWLYGTGTPKGKGCLKPAFEPVIVARNGAGALQIDAARLPGAKWPTNLLIDPVMAELLDEQVPGVKPARFFYCAKPSVREKAVGIAEAGIEPTMVENFATRMGGKGPVLRYNTHPTVKPINLMRYLCRLATPVGGLVLDPFCGSGTTGCAAVLEGMRFIGVEKEEQYVAMARARIAYWADVAAKPGDELQLPLPIEEIKS